MQRIVCLVSLVCWGLFGVQTATAGDWVRFRGPNGSGIAEDSSGVPERWSPTQNLKWKTKLPRRGSSSPIVVGDKVFVTCWSGYAMNSDGDPGDISNLKLHLVCVDRKNGKILWDKSVPAYSPEEPYRGQFAQHGYASHTPTSDGERVYAYFGKTGAVAFDLNGNQLWRRQLGTESDATGWGSAASPVLYKDLLIVTASAETQGLVALNKHTGEEVWRKEARGFGGTWGTPILVKVNDQRTDLVLAVPNEIWGFNPETGKLVWYCDGISDRSFCSSVIADNGVIYAVEGMGGGSIAVRGGGEGDVTSTHIVWRGRDNNRISTPVIVDGRIYFFGRRVANCIDAKTDQRIYQERLTGASGAVEEPEQRGEPGGGRGGFGGGPGGGFGGGRGGGRGGGQDYASPIVVDGKIYFTARNGETFIIAAGPNFKQIAANRVTTDSEDFSGTPAVSNGNLFIRSDRHLYCVGG